MSFFQNLKNNASNYCITRGDKFTYDDSLNGQDITILYLCDTNEASGFLPETVKYNCQKKSLPDCLHSLRNNGDWDVLLRKGLN